MFYYLLRLKFYYNSWQIDEWTEKNSSFVRVSMTSFKTSVKLIQYFKKTQENSYKWFDINHLIHVSFMTGYKIDKIKFRITSNYNIQN